MSIYRDRLASISKKAAAEVQQYMMDHGFDITEEFLDYAEAIVTKYGEAAGALSAQFYDDIAEYWTEVEAKRSRRAIKAAEATEVPTEAEIRKTVYGTLKESAEKIPGALSRLVKRTAEDTTLKNAIRDGAEFAWVPAGDTCAFCIMLASRGWQRASETALKGGHAEHIHANCDCTYTIRFDRKSGVEGYDPDRYLKMYENANGGTWQQRVNDMRRQQYAADPEKYRAQKRAAYERTKKVEKKKPEPLSMIYVNSKDQLAHNLQNVKPLKKYEDIAIHGVPGEALVEHETTNGVMKRYTPADLADMISENPDYHGGNVRLLSCGAGAENTGFAQELSNELGKRVIAPTETLWVAENGEMFVSDSDVLAELWYNGGDINHSIKETGYWKVFDPKEKRR